MTLAWIALLKKDARQHLWVILGSWALTSLTALMQWLQNDLSGSSTSRLSAFGDSVLWFVPVFSLLLGHRLVVREHRLKTQLFLEALPVARWIGATERYAFGLLMLLGSTFGLMTIGLLLTQETGARFAGIVLVRTLAYAGTSWSFAFAMGMLGKLRWPVYFVLALVSARLGQRGFLLIQVAPFSLVNPNTLPFERVDFPVDALMQSGGLWAACAALGLALSLFREGSIAEALARRSTARERVGFVVSIAALSYLLGVAEGRPLVPAPDLSTEPQVAQSQQRDIWVVYREPSHQENAGVALAALEDLAERLSPIVAKDRTPKIALFHDATKSAGRATLSGAQPEGWVVLSADLGEKPLDTAPLVAVAAHQVFQEVTGGRALFEPNHWLLDGLSHALASRNDAWHEANMKNAAQAARRTRLTASAIGEWERLTESVGRTTAESIGYAMVHALVRRHGQPVVERLARLVLGSGAVTGGWSWLWHRDCPEVFAEVTGESFESFVDAFRMELEQGEMAGFAEDSSLDTASAEVVVESGATGAALVYSISGPTSLFHRLCWLRHASLLPYDIYVPEGTLQKERFQWSATESSVRGRLENRYLSGDRVLAVVDCVEARPTRGSPMLRLAARRLEVP